MMLILRLREGYTKIESSVNSAVCRLLSAASYPEPSFVNRDVKDVLFKKS